MVNDKTALGGGYLVLFRGSAGAAFELQRSTDLASWFPLLWGQVPEDGLMRYEDQSPPEKGAYYRVLQR